VSVFHKHLAPSLHANAVLFSFSSPFESNFTSTYMHKSDMMMNWCIILHIFIIVYCSVVIAVKDDKTSTPTNTKSIPDLNYSPPPEEDKVEEVQTTSNKGKGEQHFKEKSRYTKMIERKKMDGTLYAYKEKISKKMKLYRTNLSPAKKAEIAQRDMARQRKTLAEVSFILKYKSLMSLFLPFKIFS